VSYAYDALAGIFGWRLAGPWRFAWLTALLLDLVLALALSPSSTALGHLLCFLLGTALFPPTRSAAVRARGDDGKPEALYSAVAEIWIRPFRSQG